MNTKRAYQMRARAQSAQATREAILEAALEAAFDRYYDDITLQEIADASDVTVQTVLRHFGSKEGLLQAVAEDTSGRIRAMTEVDVGDGTGALRRTLERYEWMGDANYRLLAQEERVAPIAALCEEGRRSHREWIEDVFGPYLPARGKARERRVLQFLLLLDVYAWRLMRREHGASKKQTEAALGELLELVVGLAEEDRKT